MQPRRPSAAAAAAAAAAAPAVAAAAAKRGRFAASLLSLPLPSQTAPASGMMNEHFTASASAAAAASSSSSSSSSADAQAGGYGGGAATTMIYVDSHDTRADEARGRDTNTWNGGKIALINCGEAQTLFDQATHFAFVPPDARATKNFGFQKFAIEPTAPSPLELTSPKTYRFTLKHHLPMLLEYFLTLTLPTIYSPVYHPCEQTGGRWSPYEFRWIDDPCEFIQSFEVYAGNVKIHAGSGTTIRLVVNRDLDRDAREKFDALVGAVPELANPAFAGMRQGAYPNVVFLASGAVPEPSIFARTVQIPLHMFFPPTGFPLFLLGPTTPIEISVTLRPVADWFRVRDVFDSTNGFPLVRPDFTQQQFLMYRFLQAPPGVDISPDTYGVSARSALFEPHLHVLASYAAITDQEMQAYRNRGGSSGSGGGGGRGFWIRTFRRELRQDVAGAVTITLPTTSGFATSLIVALQRNDVRLRNEWSNFTNWPYLGIKPTLLEPPPEAMQFNADGSMTGLYVTGAYFSACEKDIVSSFTLLFEGNERERPMLGDICRRVDVFGKCPGVGTDGVIHYQFSRTSALPQLAARPSGLQNWQTLDRVTVRLATVAPSLNPDPNYLRNRQAYICDPLSNRPAPASDMEFTPYDYRYDAHIYIEMLNGLFIDPHTGFVQLLHPL